MAVRRKESNTRGTRVIRAAAIAIVAGTACLLAGCGLFATRDPENPLTGGSAFEPPTTPNTVVRNLQNAIGFANSSDYRKCFGDSTRGTRNFSFQPSIQGISAAPTKFIGWGAQQEEEYIRNIFSELADGGVCSVTFSPQDVSEVPIDDSVHFTTDYRATFPHTRSGAEQIVEGSMQLTLHRSLQNEWYISYWRDISKSDKPSWSLLKARFIDR